jgi:hypothetical protein
VFESKGLSPQLRRKQQIFFLSPANLAGLRASYILGPTGRSEMACRLRQDGVALGELFSFISGLYFRGKLAYAQAFCAPPLDISGSFVITASAGLVPPQTIVTLDQMRAMSGTDIDAGDQRYRAPLDRDCRSLANSLGEPCDLILLGSIASAKYVEPLLDIFGERLLFPAEFVGRGDMSRGGLMLRSVAMSKELAYVPVLNATRHGRRPPKLSPLVVASRKSKGRVSPPGTPSLGPG